MDNNLTPITIIQSNKSSRKEATSIMQTGECVFHVKSQFCGPYQYGDQLLAILKRNLIANQ